MKKVDKGGIEFLYEENELYSIIIRGDYKSESIEFFTPDNFSQQLGYLPHRGGNIIKPHRHKQNKREVLFTKEVLFIKKGSVKVNFYNNDDKHIHSEILDGGDVILLCAGGHGFEIMEETVMIEVKQGPYTGEESDKERFEGVEE